MSKQPDPRQLDMGLAYTEAPTPPRPDLSAARERLASGRYRGVIDLLQRHSEDGVTIQTLRKYVKGCTDELAFSALQDLKLLGYVRFIASDTVYRRACLTPNGRRLA